MDKLDPTTTALVLLDLQKGIFGVAGGPHTADQVVKNAAALAKRFRELRATVVDVDRFGNLELNVDAAEIGELDVAPGDRVELWFALNPYYAVVAQTYADAAHGELILYEDSYGAYSIAIRDGNAASLTEAAAGDEVRIRLVGGG